MIVVSDTTPLNYLILIGEEDLLPRIVGNIVIPAAVFRELQAERTPSIVKKFIASHPVWLTVKEAPEVIDRQLADIDPGEREAILLAEWLKADAIIIDERAGRELAELRGITVIGTLGLLDAAASLGYVDFAHALERIKSEGFFVAPWLERYFLEKQLLS